MRTAALLAAFAVAAAVVAASDGRRKPWPVSSRDRATDRFLCATPPAMQRALPLRMGSRDVEGSYVVRPRVVLAWSAGSPSSYTRWVFDQQPPSRL
jgi:hypothetical protein